MIKKLIIFIILLVLFKSIQSFSQDSTITIRTLGPFNIGVFNKNKIIVEVGNLELINPDEPCEKGDIFLKVKNLGGDVIFEEEFNIGGGYTISVNVDTIFNKGTCLCFSKDFIAAPPNDRYSEYFCFNKNNEFVRITGKIYDAHEIKNITHNGKKISIIESHEWLGQFYVIFYYKFCLNGITNQYDHIKQKKYQVVIDSLSAAHWRSKENTSIDLFQCADTNKCRSQKIQINKNSKVQFLYTTKNSNIWWLCVLIDDKKGFVKGYRDFNTLGLPVAG